MKTMKMWQAILGCIVVFVIIPMGFLFLCIGEPVHDYKITLFKPDGSVAREWEGKIDIRYRDENYVKFKFDGKVIRINGSYLIEER